MKITKLTNGSLAGALAGLRQALATVEESESQHEAHECIDDNIKAINTEMIRRGLEPDDIKLIDF